MLQPVLQFVKRQSKTRLLFYAILAFTMVGIVFTLLTPGRTNNSATNQNYDGSQSKFSGLTYVGGSVVLPKTLLVFQGIVWENPAILQNQFISQFDVLLDDENPNIWLGESTIIAKIEDPDRFSLENTIADRSNNTQEGVENSQTPNATNVATNWVSQYLSGHNLSPIKSGIQYLSGAYELVNTSKALATLVEIPFAQTINGYPIRTETADGYPLIVWVDVKTSMVKKAVFYPTLLTMDSAVEFPTISAEDAIDNINSDKNARVVSATQIQDKPFSLNQISEGTLTSASIEYRLTTSQELKPFFLFKGIFTDNNGAQFGAEVVVPAI